MKPWFPHMVYFISCVNRHHRGVTNFVDQSNYLVKNINCLIEYFYILRSCEMGKLIRVWWYLIINKLYQTVPADSSQKIRAVIGQPITVLNSLALPSHESHWAVLSVTKMIFRTKPKLTLIPFKHLNQKTVQSTSAHISNRPFGQMSFSETN